MLPAEAFPPHLPPGAEHPFTTLQLAKKMRRADVNPNKLLTDIRRAFPSLQPWGAQVVGSVECRLKEGAAAVTLTVSEQPESC